MTMYYTMHRVLATVADTTSNDTNGLALIVVVMLLLALLAYGVSKMK